uniref:Uncharacterized protein n=1 Tax=Trichuris muris TaxID=70415 RepID=A0A5S6Q4Y2_TRIMR
METGHVEKVSNTFFFLLFIFLQLRRSHRVELQICLCNPSFAESAVGAVDVLSSNGLQLADSGNPVSNVSSSPPPVESSQGIISSSWKVDGEGISSSLIVETMAARDDSTLLPRSFVSDSYRHPKRDISCGEPSRTNEESTLAVQSFAQRIDSIDTIFISDSTNRSIGTGDESFDILEQPESSGQVEGDVINEMHQIEETSEALPAEVDNANHDLTSNKPVGKPQSPP